jgi:hypothetical protein
MICTLTPPAAPVMRITSSAGARTWVSVPPPSALLPVDLPVDVLLAF